MGTTVFKADFGMLLVFFIGSMMMLALGIWSTFYITDEMIADFGRPPPMGGAGGPFLLVLSVLMVLFTAPMPGRTAKRNLILSPSGLRFGAMSVSWPEVKAINLVEAHNCRQVVLVLVDPVAHWAGKKNWILRRFRSTPSIGVSATMLTISVNDVFAAINSYWHTYRDGQMPEVTAPAIQEPSGRSLVTAENFWDHYERTPKA